MKRIVCLSILIAVSGVFGVSTYAAVKLHNNTVNIIIGVGLHGKQSLKFTPDKTNWYKVTTGQPWGGITKHDCYCSSYRLHLSIAAGRKKSAAVATWFRQKAEGAKNSSINTDNLACNTWPKNLNFAVSGILSIYGQDVNENIPIAIGQGKNAAGIYDWWICSPYLKTDGLPPYSENLLLTGGMAAPYNFFYLENWGHI